MNSFDFAPFAYVIACGIIVAFVAQSLAFLVSGRQQPAEQIDIPTSSSEVYTDEAGNLKYAEGSCVADSNCYIGGCSSEVCSSTPGVITTCELKPDAPDQEIYRCGCNMGSCAWIMR